MDITSAASKNYQAREEERKAQAKLEASRKEEQSRFKSYEKVSKEIAAGTQPQESLKVKQEQERKKLELAQQELNKNQRDTLALLSLLL